MLPDHSIRVHTRQTNKRKEVVIKKNWLSEISYHFKEPNKLLEESDKI